MKTLLKTILMTVAICAVSASAGAQSAQGNMSGETTGTMGMDGGSMSDTTTTTTTGSAGMGTTGTTSTTARTLATSDVRLLQQELASRGYYMGTIDGVWGPMTTRAIEDYQSSMGLPVTGTLTTSMLSDLGVQVSTDTRGVEDISPAAGDDNSIMWDNDGNDGSWTGDTQMDPDVNNEIDMDDGDWNTSP